MWLKHKAHIEDKCIPLVLGVHNMNRTAKNLVIKLFTVKFQKVTDNEIKAQETLKNFTQQDLL